MNRFSNERESEEMKIFAKFNWKKKKKKTRNESRKHEKGKTKKRKKRKKKWTIECEGGKWVDEVENE